MCEEVKGCRFCKAENSAAMILINDSCFISCGKCDARGPLMRTEHEAIKGWNAEDLPQNKTIIEVLNHEVEHLNMVISTEKEYSKMIQRQWDVFYKRQRLTDLFVMVIGGIGMIVIIFMEISK